MSNTLLQLWLDCANGNLPGLAPPVSSVPLVAKQDISIKPSLEVRQGQTVFCSVAKANVDVSCLKVC